MSVPTLTSEVTIARRHALGDLLRRTAVRVPDKLALVHRDRRLTFVQLNESVNRAANALTAEGIRKGDRIAILSHNSYEFVVLYFALAKLGAISVPINFMLGAGEVAFILGHAGAKGIVVENALRNVAAEAVTLVYGDQSPVLLAVTDAPASDGWLAIEDWLSFADASEPQVELSDDDPLQILYTSGTESRPKGAVLTSRNLIAQYVTCAISGEMTGDDVEIHSLPLYHTAQLHCFLTPDIYFGATSIILDAPNPERILEAIERERATKLFAPPTVWIALLRSPRFDASDLSSLRKGYYGAASMPVEVLREMAERLPGVRLFNFYGQTEMSPVATILRPEDQIRKAGSAGRPGVNVETRLVDDFDEPVETGEVGEIVHRGPHTMLGYWNDPEKTEDAFRNGWFHSGDLGRFDEDGYLTIVDRKKDMINTGGENVASREVEEVLYEHPDVSEVAVFGVPHPHWIEAVVAAVVCRPGCDLADAELTDYVRARLAPFKVPKEVVFVEALPKNPSGKILKRDLRKTLSDRFVED